MDNDVPSCLPPVRLEEGDYEVVAEPSWSFQLLKFADQIAKTLSILEHPSELNNLLRSLHSITVLLWKLILLTMVFSSPIPSFSTFNPQLITFEHQVSTFGPKVDTYEPQDTTFELFLI